MTNRDFRKEYDHKDGYELFGGTPAWEQVEGYTGPDIRWEWVEELLDEIDRLRAEVKQLQSANGVDDDGNLLHMSISAGE